MAASRLAGRVVLVDWLDVSRWSANVSHPSLTEVDRLPVIIVD